MDNKPLAVFVLLLLSPIIIMALPLILIFVGAMSILGFCAAIAITLEWAFDVLANGKDAAPFLARF